MSDLVDQVVFYSNGRVIYESWDCINASFQGSDVGFFAFQRLPAPASVVRARALSRAKRARENVTVAVVGARTTMVKARSSAHNSRTASAAKRPTVSKAVVPVGSAKKCKNDKCVIHIDLAPLLKEPAAKKAKKPAKSMTVAVLDTLSFYGGFGDAVAIEIDAANPKRPGTRGYERYELYKSATSKTEFLLLGGWESDYADCLDHGQLVEKIP